MNQTNFDRITASPEVLANSIAELEIRIAVIVSSGCGKRLSFSNSEKLRIKNELMEWLKQEAEGC